jgi:hypothetical protein
MVREPAGRRRSKILDREAVKFFGEDAKAEGSGGDPGERSGLTARVPRRGREG